MAVTNYMERLAEEVSNQPLGQKWQQLYIRLGLEARKKYSITVEHKDKKEGEKIRCCIRDTIALWRGSESVAGKSEKEMMKRLLTALKQVQGFEGTALRLGETYGVELDKGAAHSPERQSLQSHLEKSTSSERATRSDQSLVYSHEMAETPTDHRDGLRTLDSYDTADLRQTISSSDSSPSLRHLDMDPKALPMAVQSEHDMEEESGSSFSVSCSVASDRETLYRQSLLQAPIDMRNKVHKFAILDIVQRISVNHWILFTSLLGLNKKTVEVLSKEKATEEKYYHAIKEWLRIKGERATFAALNDHLEHCSERGAQAIMKMRLECNRDLLEGATS